MKNSRMSLSPLLAILIGLVVTIIAGILLAQLYLNYAGIISSRPLAVVEYADLIEHGSNDILAINLKNAGNVPISDVSVEADTSLTCEVRYSESTVGYGNTAPPGSAVSIVCVGDLTSNPGEEEVVILAITFSDGSTQKLPLSLRARIV